MLKTEKIHCDLIDIYMLEISFTKKVFANLLYFSPRGQKRCAETETFEVPGSCCPMSGTTPLFANHSGFVSMLSMTK